jgi:hypothetical protein
MQQSNQTPGWANCQGLFSSSQSTARWKEVRSIYNKCQNSMKKLVYCLISKTSLIMGQNLDVWAIHLAAIEA